jgi:hypothetical protein
MHLFVYDVLLVGGFLTPGSFLGLFYSLLTEIVASYWLLSFCLNHFDDGQLIIKFDADFLA